MMAAGIVFLRRRSDSGNAFVANSAFAFQDLTFYLPLILSDVTGCFNEEDNVTELYERIVKVFAERLPNYPFDVIFIDNASTDGTVAVLRTIASNDKRVKVIVNNRNFGHIRSPSYACLQARGDAVIAMTSDLQDPPEMIPQFVQKWEEGFKVVLAQKTNSEESPLFFIVRKLYYDMVNRLSDVELVKNATGFGLYDQGVVEDLRRIDDPYPYARGLVCDLGYSRTLIPFTQPARKRGFSKNNLYTLWDMAMLGITNHSKVPLRLATLPDWPLRRSACWSQWVTLSTSSCPGTISRSAWLRSS